VKNRPLIWTFAAPTILLTGIIGAYFGNSLISGIAVIISYLSHRQGIKEGRLRGRTDKLKAADAFTGNLIEFVGITSAIFFTSSWPVVLAAASAGLAESFLNEVRNNSIKLNSVLIGRPERVILVGLSLTASYFNEYLLIYGLIAVGFTALFESVRQLFLLLKKEM
jgi:hypothetical protein